MKYCFIVPFILFYSSPCLLYHSYVKEGVSKTAVGAMPFRTEITLKQNHTFAYKQETYKRVKNEKQIITSDSSNGNWFVRGDTLLLDFHPNSSDANKKLDIYLIKRKSLKRITFKEHIIYRAEKNSGSFMVSTLKK